jgi:DNA-binding response OmpR family regulator
VTEKVNEAMKIMQTDIIDLILLDMLLSGVNGVDVCMNLKNDPKTKNTPLIMISAHPNAKDLCMNAGADDFIPKPFDMEDIISRINRLLVSQSC